MHLGPGPQPGVTGLHLLYHIRNFRDTIFVLDPLRSIAPERQKLVINLFSHVIRDELIPLIGHW